ncbi:MAG TPA: c-type cytochrome [Sphingobacteriaceae bacterium]
MKKSLFVLALCAGFAACSSDSNKSADQSDSAAATENYAESRQSEYDSSVNATGTESAGAAGSAEEAKGEKLIAQSDCLSCHKVSEKLVGPAYQEVAAKYEDNDKNIEYLAGKIKTGGAGVWGEVAMTPHPNLSDDDAKEMAKYILSLRK